MRSYFRVFGIVGVFLLATVAWLVLAGVTEARKTSQTEALRSNVENLWGSPQTQKAPTLSFRWVTEEKVVSTEWRDDKEVKVENVVRTDHARAEALAASDLYARVDSDLRRKGLAWYSLYDVGFTGKYEYVHTGAETGQLDWTFAFPSAGAIYDDFVFKVDGRDVSSALDPASGVVRSTVAVAPGQRVSLEVHYKSRGLDAWSYQPADGVSRLSNFRLRMHTNFADIDYPTGTLSPSHRQKNGDGWDLSWDFERIVTGSGMGMLTPQRIQPGELASELALSAPISLFFFFFVIFVLATLRDIDIHPINYLMIAGAFFAFHLLFAYSADHLTVEWAFALASTVSIALVVSYLRLVVSSRFAFVEAALAQLLYLVGFSLAHFWDGYTGLTTTVLAIATLFAIMQLTGRVRWSEVFDKRPTRAPLSAT